MLVLIFSLWLAMIGEGSKYSHISQKLFLCEELCAANKVRLGWGNFWERGSMRGGFGGAVPLWERNKGLALTLSRFLPAAAA